MLLSTLLYSKSYKNFFGREVNPAPLNEDINVLLRTGAKIALLDDFEFLLLPALFGRRQLLLEDGVNLVDILVGRVQMPGLQNYDQNR